MGYYIQTPSAKSRAQYLMKKEGAVAMPPDMGWNDRPDGKSIVCVVDNGSFEAAGYAFDKAEYEMFNRPDGRPRAWLLMDTKRVRELSRFPRERQTEEAE
jgi:hypothetical protein